MHQNIQIEKKVKRNACNEDALRYIVSEKEQAVVEEEEVTMKTTSCAFFPFDDSILLLFRIPKRIQTCKRQKKCCSKRDIVYNIYRWVAE